MHGAVTTEVRECTEIGSQVLREGGNAADAMVASVICIGIFNPHLSGLGGGGFMLVRDPSGTYETIDFRESAPALSTEDMYVKNISLSLLGGLAVGTYGEAAGLEMLHRKYGRLSWRRLFEPSINYARHGFRLLPEVALNIADPQHRFMVDDPTWAAVYAPEGVLLKANQTVKRPRLADTLEAIAKDGASVLYKGYLANATIDAASKAGGILSLSDLAQYKPISREALTTKYRDYTLHSSPSPASGAIALSALNILSGYDMSQDTNVTLHILIESLKFAYGQRTVLGDPDFVCNASTIEKSFLQDQAAAEIRTKLSIDKTQHISVYDPLHHEILNDHGTSQLVTADNTGLVISLTSTVNTHWGSRIMVPESGIILNNEQNDFSTPGISNAFGFIPTSANFIRPYKRPLSSIAPVIVDLNGSFVFAVGAAGGSRITSAVIQTLIHHLDRHLSAADAVARPRVHDQIVPEFTTFEESFEQSSVDAMKAIGHNVMTVKPGLSIVLAISRNTSSFEATSDPRYSSGSAAVV